MHIESIAAPRSHSRELSIRSVVSTTASRAGETSTSALAVVVYPAGADGSAAAETSGDDSAWAIPAAANHSAMQIPISAPAIALGDSGSRSAASTFRPTDVARIGELGAGSASK